MPAELTLLRHGKSVWNEQNRFTGWADAPLSAAGGEEAKAAARALLKHKLSFDAAFTSRLQRAIRTLWLVLEEMDLMWLPQRADWRFNERHYGALQGMNKAETAARYGDEQVRLWRRSYDTAPPAADEAAAAADARYAGVAAPRGESLRDVVPRVWGGFNDVIAPLLRDNKRVILVSHGNALRALIKRLENIGDDEISEQEIPTGAPLTYTLDARLTPLSKRWL